MLNATEVIVLVVTFFVAGIILKWIRGTEHAGRRYPPSLPALPLVGSLPFLESLEKLPEYFMKTSEKLGPIISFYSGRKLAVVLNSKEVIAEALVKNSVAFANRPHVYTEKNVANIDLRGLAFHPYDESFKKYHKISLSILKEFGFGVKDVSERMILDDVEELVDEIKCKNGKAFDVKLMLSMAVSRIAMDIFFGKTFSRDEAHMEALIDNMEKHAYSLDPAFDVAPLIRFIPYYKKKLITSARANLELRGCIAEGVKSSLLEDEDNFVKRFIQIEGPDYDREELFYILRDLCGGALETVTSTIRWAMVYLANNPAVQDRLDREIGSVISRDRLPSLDDRLHLPYTEAVMLETLRIKTVLPFAIPHALANDRELSGYFIPKDTLILVNLYSVHMNREVWKDPEVFRPERFLDEDNNVVGRERIIPFSLGKRACLGENLARKSLFLFLTSLLHHFDIRPPEGQNSIIVSDICNIVLAPSAFDVRLIPKQEI